MRRLETDTDYLSLTAEEFAQLDDWQLQEVLQLLAGKMAVEQMRMRECQPAYQDYISAKEMFGHYKQTASALQTLLRSKV